MMHEWHVPWDYIDERWTHKQIEAFAQAMEKRLKKKAQRSGSYRKSRPGGGSSEVVPFVTSIPIKKRKRAHAG